MGTPHQELTFPIVEHEGGLGEGADERAQSSRIQSRGGATPVTGVLQNKEEKLPNFRYSPSTGLTRNWTPSKSGRPDNLLAAEILGRGEASGVSAAVFGLLIPLQGNTARPADVSLLDSDLGSFVRSMHRHNIGSEFRYK